MAKWSKQTYEAVASTIKTAESVVADGGHEYTDNDALRTVTSHFARLFAGDNPRFDADKFVKACGF